MYSRIQNPETGRMVSITGVTGKRILKKYLQFLVGGMSQLGGGVDAVPATDAKRKLLIYHVEWCGHCQRLKPELVKLEKDLPKNSSVEMIDCEDPKNDEKKANCEKAGFPVQGFPTILLEVNGKITESYEGDRTEEGLSEFLKGEKV